MSPGASPTRAHWAPDGGTLERSKLLVVAAEVEFPATLSLALLREGFDVRRGMGIEQACLLIQGGFVPDLALLGGKVPPDACEVLRAHPGCEALMVVQLLEPGQHSPVPGVGDFASLPMPEDSLAEWLAMHLRSTQPPPPSAEQRLRSREGRLRLSEFGLPDGPLPPAGEAAPRRHLRLVVLSERAFVRAMVQATLTSLGHTVAVAASVEEAKEALPVDVAVVDGSRAAGRPAPLFSDLRRAGVQHLLLVHPGDPAEVPMATVSAGADAGVPDSFSTDDLDRALRAAFESRGSQDVVERLTDPDARKRRQAARELAVLGVDDEAHLLHSLLYDEDPEVVADALRALARLKDPALVDTLARVLELPPASYTHFEVRAETILALEVVGGPVAERLLLKLSKDPDPAVRVLAAQALKQPV